MYKQDTVLYPVHKEISKYSYITVESSYLYGLHRHLKAECCTRIMTVLTIIFWITDFHLQISKLWHSSQQCQTSVNLPRLCSRPIYTQPNTQALVHWSCWLLSQLFRVFTRCLHFPSYTVLKLLSSHTHCRYGFGALSVYTSNGRDVSLCSCVTLLYCSKTNNRSYFTSDGQNAIVFAR